MRWWIETYERHFKDGEYVIVGDYAGTGVDDMT